MSVLSLRTDAGVLPKTETHPKDNKIIQLETLWQRHARQVYTLALRLLADGTNERGLAVAEVRNNQVTILDAAPRSFGGAGF